MIIRNLADAERTSRKVDAPTWTSTRLLLRSDNMGFSFHITTIHTGTTTRMHYRNHVEAVYCIRGEGRIHDLETGITHPVTAGTLYALDKHDRHELTAVRELVLACVFNPPLNGRETHDATGAYPLEADPASD